MNKLVASSLVGLALATVVPTIEIEAGVYLPMVGLGTWEYNDSMAEAAVTIALGLGYTHIDTALVYGNQKGIGRALAASGRARDSYFITTKIPGGSTYAQATADLNTDLEELGLDYVDHVMVHFPATWAGEGGKELRVEGWKALEDFKKAGKTRSIGVSHFCKQHLDDILAVNTTAIAINQVEYHIGMGSADKNATDDKAYCDSIGVTYMSFSTLCGPCGTDELRTGDLVVNIGKKYGKSGSQVSLKWAVQQGIPVIPKSSSAQHQQENLDLFSWTLSKADMQTLTLAKSPPACGGGATYPGASGDCVIV